MQNVTKIAHVLFLLLFLSLPLSKGATSVAVGGLLLLSILRFFSKEMPKIKQQDYALLSPIAIFVALLISLLYTENLERGFNHIYRQNTLLVFPIFFYTFQQLVRQKWQQYASIFVYANLFVASLVLVFSLFSQESLQQWTQQIGILQDFTPQHKQTAFGAYSPFMDRLHFGYLLGISILFQIWRCLKGHKLSLQLPILLVLLAAFAILGARGAQLAFLATIPIWIAFAYGKWLRANVQKRLGKTLANALLVGFIGFMVIGLPYLTYKNVPAVSERYNQLIWEIRVFHLDDLKSHNYVHFTSVRRIMSWNNTLQLIQYAPLTGVGIGDYETELASIYEEDGLGFPVNSHHQFLYYWAAAGILAVLAFAASMLLFLSQTWKEKNGSNLALGLSFWCFYMLVFMFDVPLLYQAGSTGFLAFFGLILLHQNALRDKQKKEF